MDIQIYDTTLRDGSQRAGLSLTCQDKIRVAQLLDEFGVAYIEGGWPGSNPKDAEFFERAKQVEFRTAKLAAFGATCRPGSQPRDDANCRALLESQTPTVTIVGKTWTLHVSDVLRTTPDENLRIIRDTMAYFKAEGREVIFDAEHFFDGYKADAAYAVQVLRAAREGGAEVLTLCDTNGGTMPWELEEIVAHIRREFPATVLGIHVHNDSELAVANSLAAVRAGCAMVQGTINGYGERCGNANLCAIIPDLELKMGKTCLPPGHLEKLTRVSHAVSEIANLAPDDHMAYVGRSAFAHKGGIHVAAMRHNALSYQHVDPLCVGNEMRVVVSELAGRGNVVSKAEEFGISVEGNQTEVNAVLQRIKELEAQGFHFESAEASVELMLRRTRPDYRPIFEMIDFWVMVEHRQGRGLLAEANIKLNLNGEIVHVAAEGNGPVNALDTALRKALLPFYPALGTFHLADYKVRILDGNAGTAATARVLIETANHIQRWSTVGASPNIIEASWLALYDSVEYGLTVAKI
ncbi:MAG: citramalate synthase [Chloroflexi bacterium]|nr:citramalate synthase [Chloroflexota bacterium]